MSFGNLLKTVGQIGNAGRASGWTLVLRKILRDHPHSDVDALGSSPSLVQKWATAAPQVRAAVLLDAAWASRKRTVPPGSSPAQVHAHDLNRCARAHKGDRKTFRGPSFPAMPLPGNAGAYASLLGFAQDKAEISLKTALMLLAA
mgnify:CR=1 FL=1